MQARNTRAKIRHHTGQRYRFRCQSHSLLIFSSRFSQFSTILYNSPLLNSCAGTFLASLYFRIPYAPLCFPCENVEFAEKYRCHSTRFRLRVIHPIGYTFAIVSSISGDSIRLETITTTVAIVRLFLSCFTRARVLLQSRLPSARVQAA